MPSCIIQEAIEAAKAGESGQYEIDLPGGAKGRVIIQQTSGDGAGISKDDIMGQLGEVEAKVEIISIDTRTEAQARED
jgi:hypothetical protein